MTHVFIAHVEADAHVALSIALDLEQRGYRAWCYEVDSRIGSYRRNIEEHISASAAVLVIVSARATRDTDQLGREIVLSERNGKPFIPVLCGIATDDVDRRVPKTWREAFGDAVLISIDQEGLYDVVVRVVEGLAGLNIPPGVRDEDRITRVGKALARARPGVLRRVNWAVREMLAHSAPARAAAVTLLVFALGALGWALVSPASDSAPAEDGTFRLWVEEPMLDDATDQRTRLEFRELRIALEDALTRTVRSATWKPPVRFFRDRDLEVGRSGEACPADGPARARCLLAHARAERVDAQVVPQLRPAGGNRQLVLDFARRPFSGRDWTLKKEDANLSLLAMWGAEEIAVFIVRASVPDAPPPDEAGLRKQIRSAWQVQRTYSDLLEDSLAGMGGVPEQHGWLRWPLASAWAQTPGPDAKVRDLLERLRLALMTQDASQVAALFQGMSSAQQDALQRYFKRMAPGSLTVEFRGPEITVEEGRAAISLLRVDDFVDEESEEKVRLAVRLMMVCVSDGGVWKMQSLAKAG